MKKFLLIILFSLLLLYELSIMYSEVGLRTGEEWTGANPIILLSLALCGVLYILLSKSKGRMPMLGRSLVAFDIYVIVISIYHGLIQHSSVFGLSTVLTCIQPLLLFFVMYYVRQEEEMDKLSSRLFFFMFIAFVIGFFVSIILKREYNSELFVEDNNSYYLMYLLPALLLVNDKALRLKIYMIVSFFCVFLSMKRGGILGITGGLVVSYLLNRNKQNRKTNASVRVGGVIIIAAVIAYFLNNTMGGLVIDRFEEISDTGGSGRDLIWSEGVLLINSSTGVEKWIGHGFDSARGATLWGVSLHNDFLEIVYDFGWIGLVLFIIFVVVTIIFIRKNKNTIMAPPVGMALTICLLTMMAAHVVIYIQYFNLIALCLGAACGEHVRQQMILRENNLQ